MGECHTGDVPISSHIKGHNIHDMTGDVNLCHLVQVVFSPSPFFGSQSLSLTHSERVD